LLYVLNHPLLRVLAGSAGLFHFCGMFFATLYALYVSRVLGMAPFLYGLLIAAGGVSALVGAALSERVIRRLGLGLAIGGGLFMYGCIGLLVPLARGPVAVVAIILFMSQLVGDITVAVYLIGEAAGELAEMDAYGGVIKAIEEGWLHGLRLAVQKLDDVLAAWAGLGSPARSRSAGPGHRSPWTPGMSASGRAAAAPGAAPRHHRPRRRIPTRRAEDQSRVVDVEAPSGAMGASSGRSPPTSVRRAGATPSTGSPISGRRLDRHVRRGECTRAAARFLLSEGSGPWTRRCRRRRLCMTCTRRAPLPLRRGSWEHREKREALPHPADRPPPAPQAGWPQTADGRRQDRRQRLFPRLHHASDER